jgi:predicted ester cyclase
MKTIIESNQALIEDYFYKVWNKGDYETLYDIIHPAYVNHNPSTPNPPPGPKGLVPIIQEMRKGIPDLLYRIKETIVTQDRVVARVNVTGTHLDVLFGIAPTGRKIDIAQINIEAIRDGKIIEHWRVTEELKMMQQLGIMG